MQPILSDILDNLLGLLLLEGSYDIEEMEDGFKVSIETTDAGRLIGARGESLEGLQLLVNQMLSRKMGEGKEEEFKRVMVDVMGWRKQKEEELSVRAKELANQVLESGQQIELEPMSAWQRRVVHMVIQDLDGLSSESIGEGLDRHLIIKVKIEDVKSQKS